MSTNDYQTLLFLLVPFFIFIIVIISYFLFKSRAQKYNKSVVSRDCFELEIDITDKFSHVINQNIFLLKIMPFFVLLSIYFFVMFVTTLGSGPEGFVELFTVNSQRFQFSLAIFVLFFIGGALAHLKEKESILNLELAIQLAQGRRLFLKINKTNLTIPALALVNPAFWRAARLSKREITFKSEDILSVEVYPKVGNSPAQFLLKCQGENHPLGLGGGELIEFGIGIKREFFKEYEKNILDFFHTHLNEKLIIRDSNITK